MLVTIRDDTWYVLNMHITPYSKRWDYSDISGGGHKNMDLPTWLKAANTLEKPQPQLTTNQREIGFVKTRDNTQRTLMQYTCPYD